MNRVSIENLQGYRAPTYEEHKRFKRYISKNKVSDVFRGLLFACIGILLIIGSFFINLDLSAQILCFIFPGIIGLFLGSLWCIATFKNNKTIQNNSYKVLECFGFDAVEYSNDLNDSFSVSYKIKIKDLYGNYYSKPFEINSKEGKYCLETGKDIKMWLIKTNTNTYIPITDIELSQ